MNRNTNRHESDHECKQDQIDLIRGHSSDSCRFVFRIWLKKGNMRLLFLMVLGMLMFAPAIRAAEKATIVLNWVPEPEFGGIYAAKESGAFAKHNLDVAIKPGGAGAPTWQQVASGKAEFGV